MNFEWVGFGKRGSAQNAKLNWESRGENGRWF